MLNSAIPQGQQPLQQSRAGSLEEALYAPPEAELDSNMSALEAAQEGLSLDRGQENEVYTFITDNWSQTQGQLQGQLDRFESSFSLASSQSVAAELSGNSSASASAQYQASSSASALANANRDYSYQYGQYLYQLATLDPSGAA